MIVLKFFGVSVTLPIDVEPGVLDDVQALLMRRPSCAGFLYPN
jgi:hypothetical protein